MVFDTSGQVTRENDSRVLTLAGVGIAEEASGIVRALIEKRLGPSPLKWRDGALEGFRSVADIIASQTLRVAVTHITGISKEAWLSFWDEGQRKADKLKQLTGESAPFAGGHLSIRLHLFATVFAQCAGHVLKKRGWKGPPPQGRRDGVEFSATFDTDISNLEARAILTETLKDWGESGRFGQFASLDMQCSGCFRTEQEEPLILLADYVAGTFNHVHPDAVISIPVAPLQEVRDAVRHFRDTLGSRLQELDKPFDEIHPLMGMWNDP